MNKAPQKAKRPCLSSGCKDFASNKGYCDKHQSRVKQRDRDRGTAHQRGYDAEWKKHRDQFLLEHPLCVECRRKGYVMPATVVDHIVPHKGDKELFWDKKNWQPLCETHHNIKTASEDRGSWSPVVKQVKANRDSKNEFQVNDRLLVATEYAQECLLCDDKTVFTVIEVHDKTVFVQDEDGNGGRLHHSHFKRHTETAHVS
ncbi:MULTISPECIES: HNH endonuclease signature motif containing protein [Acinetobacter]|uniref:HNH endonuclease signature motif containing protein n=1 Tax=Acinetobacter TaxID=469 RepID=UPI0015D15C55|nr:MULTISPECIES: HNH endonuclease signature motif containing protein [Acinetobacter]MDM1274034.1 HNH endonuclease [Acinetobacter indicus]